MSLTLETMGAAFITSGAMTGLVTWLTTRRNRSAERAQVEVTTYLMLIKPLEQQLKAMGEEVAQLREETAQCHRERDADRREHRIEREVDRSRIRTLEYELGRYKGGPTAHYETEATTTIEGEIP